MEPSCTKNKTKKSTICSIAKENPTMEVTVIKSQDGVCKKDLLWVDNAKFKPSESQRMVM